MARRDPLPAIGKAQFRRRLEEFGGAPLEPGLLQPLLTHYAELRRWNRTLSLIGPGTASNVVERHYGESLAALSLFPEAAQRVLDVGSGAGFPGWVLAAARADLHFVLAEPNRRKRLFLESAARKASIDLDLSAARVGDGVDSMIAHPVDLITVRALALDAGRLSAIGGLLRPGGRLLWWIAGESLTLPEPAQTGERIALRGRRAVVSVEGLAQS